MNGVSNMQSLSCAQTSVNLALYFNALIFYLIPLTGAQLYNF
jgi:hypothetical protein